MLKIYASSNRRAVDRLIKRRKGSSLQFQRRVHTILAGVRTGGDRALLKYARRFDGLKQPVELTSEEIQKGADLVSKDVRAAIRIAARHIKRIARQQVTSGWKIAVVPGVQVEQRVTPLERVGCYVPGGRYPLPSSLLMTALPARIAGVREIIVACPRPEPSVLEAAREAGVSRVFRIGGAHAIAALAYGTASVPRVDKIVGPGNSYVATAKTLVSADCPIDLHAGPSEIVILSQNGRANWIAADLLAQAEHDPDARALLLTPNRRLAEEVAKSISTALTVDGPERIALRKNGGIIVTKDVDEAIVLANRIAPEHFVCDNTTMAKAVTNAGAIFIGPYTAQAAGDYATGSNHVLPTNSVARYRGGLNVSDFVKVCNVQRVTKRGLATIAPTVLALARAEGLFQHARSVQVRLR
jgi:histidinol dehydrogenase